MPGMKYIHRQLEKPISSTLERGKSILLLGPRQTGKTTLIKNQLHPDLSYSFIDTESRLRYEKTPHLLARELSAAIKNFKKMPIICIDEVQKIPLVMDIAQDFIDRKQAQFILTGSSARKLKHGSQVNLLPGRVVVFNMDPLNLNELPPSIELEELLIYGSLPAIIDEPDSKNKEIDLISYVSTYLEEEIRAEALVRNVGAFSRFLELAASESGNIINFTKLSQDVGVADSTIASYYQILEDCLIVQRIDPIIKSPSHRRLIKSPKYLFFDLGIRRACANEGANVSQKTLSLYFEQFIGLELIRFLHANLTHAKLRYWRDANGPEIDFVLESHDQFVPIEVKWSTAPSDKEAKHLKKFIAEYPHIYQGIIVCRTPAAYELEGNILVLPWQNLLSHLESTFK